MDKCWRRPRTPQAADRRLLGLSLANCGVPQCCFHELARMRAWAVHPPAAFATSLLLEPLTRTPDGYQGNDNNKNLITSRSWTLVQSLLSSVVRSLSGELIYVLTLAWKNLHAIVCQNTCKTCLHTRACRTHMKMKHEMTQIVS